MKIDFVRGHMGGNLIILLRGDQVPIGRELETAVQLMGPNHLYAHETGILYTAGKQGEIEVKIAEPTLPSFISACGGLTQVLGAALIGTDLGNIFGVDLTGSPAEVLLQTDCGPVALSIEHHDRKAVRIKTDMECFVEECYEHGVSREVFRGVGVIRAGKFLVVNADNFKKIYPEADFITWDRQTRRNLLEIQNEFQEKTGEIEPNVALYDWHPERGGHLRAVFPHYVESDVIEPSCGTGSVALGLAVSANGELDRLVEGDNQWVTLNIESGGGFELGGSETTALEMNIVSGKVKSAAFSHSRVEITSIGQAIL